LFEVSGVAVDIFGEVEPLILVFYQNVFVSALVDGARVMVPIVVLHGVGDGETTHEIGNDQIAIFLANHEVKMIGHEAVGE
jgi:hypothetical protein